MMSAIRQLRQVELEERAVGDERRCDLGTREGRLDLLRRRGTNDDGSALFVCVPQRVVVGRVQDECVVEVELAFERDLGHPAPGGSEPAFPHNSTVSPGWIWSTCALVSPASSC